MSSQPAKPAGEGRAPLLQVDGVTLQYKTERHLVTATYRVSFDVYRADRFVLLGPSGCGKSTLLKAVGGYMAPTEGTMRLKGVPMRGPGPDRMFVFQEFDQLLPWKTVKQNVMFALQASGKMRGKAAEAQAMRYIDKVNLTKFADSYPHTLSGGMKQRVAIARAMAMEPDILLMDEPFAALDALTRRKMQEELLQLWEDTRFTVLFVTHSIPEAVLIGNRILLLSPHPGQVKGELNSDGSDPARPASGRSCPTASTTCCSRTASRNRRLPPWLTCRAAARCPVRSADAARVSARRVAGGDIGVVEKPLTVCAAAGQPGLAQEGASSWSSSPRPGSSMRAGSTTRCWCRRSPPPWRRSWPPSAAATSRQKVSNSVQLLLQGLCCWAWGWRWCSPRSP